MAVTTLFYRHLLQQSHNTSYLPGTTFFEAFLTSCQVDVSTTLFWNEILCLMTMISGAPLAFVDRCVDGRKARSNDAHSLLHPFQAS